jgi:hypothetical protein
VGMASWLLVARLLSAQSALRPPSRLVGLTHPSSPPPAIRAEGCGIGA